MVIDSKEVYKIDGVLKKGLHFLRSRVYTQNGAFVGIMEDLIFDGNINQVISIITKKPLSEETRIINASRILSVLPGKIVVRDVVSHVRKTVFSRGASIASPLKI
jgi:sporulation protein YlmC with PRC-barrel domain